MNKKEKIQKTWVEKYRPEKLDEISAQTNVVKSLKSALITKNIPHLIFFGPSGCGKTSTIINLATAVQELRKRYPGIFGGLQLIATCDVQPVLTRWGQLLYHSGFPFGIGSKRYLPHNNPELLVKLRRKGLEEMNKDRDCIDITMRF